MNQLLKDAIYPVVGIWDADVLLSEQQVLAAIECINKGAIMCFPYDGNFCLLGELASKAVRSDTEILQQYQNQPFTRQPSVGGAFLVNKEKYLAAGGENECFYGWGYEDTERVKRMEILDFPIARAKNPIFHLHHSGFAMDENQAANIRYNLRVFLYICSKNKPELSEIIKNRTDMFSYLNSQTPI